MGNKGMKTKEKPSKTRKNKGGRPTVRSVKLMKTIENLALLGLSDEKIADVIGVSRSTFALWKKDDQGFSDRIFQNREGAHASVSRSMFERALGYKVKSVKIFADAKSGKVVQVPFWEHYPPDVAACMAILKNRWPELWRDRIDVKHDVSTKLAERLREARSRTKQLNSTGEEA